MLATLEYSMLKLLFAQIAKHVNSRLLIVQGWLYQWLQRKKPKKPLKACFSDKLMAKGDQ